MLQDTIVSSNHTVCLVGGARVSAQVISSIFPIVDQFVAVDGGADHLAKAGILPAAVIGDLDSISASGRATFADRLHQIADQSTTDFEKALMRVSAPLVICIGFLGVKWFAHSQQAKRQLEPVLLKVVKRALSVKESIEVTQIVTSAD